MDNFVAADAEERRASTTVASAAPS